MPLSDFPRYQLTFGPSPVHPLERLTAHLGGARIWAKREDCNAGLAYGGNKVRKLEYLVPDALAQGAPGGAAGNLAAIVPIESLGEWIEVRQNSSKGAPHLNWRV